VDWLRRSLLVDIQNEVIADCAETADAAGPLIHPYHQLFPAFSASIVLDA